MAIAALSSASCTERPGENAPAAANPAHQKPMAGELDPARRARLQALGEWLKEKGVYDYAPAVEDLEVLVELRISGIQVEMPLPEGMWDLSNLETLDFDGVKGLTPSMDGIEKLGKLDRLRFSCTDLTSLPDGIKSLGSLGVLDLAGTKLGSFPEIVTELKGLEMLDLSGTDLEEVPESIGNMTNLTWLYLNGLGKLKTLPNEMGNSVKLMALHLSGAGFESCPEVLKKLRPQLNELYLDDTKLVDYFSE